MCKVSRSKVLVLIAPVFIALFSAGCKGEPPVNPPPPSLGKIVFVSDRDGDPEIFIMRMDDIEAEPMQLTHNGSIDVSPDISIDGTKIVYSTNENQNQGVDLMSMNVDGSALRILTDNDYGERDANWSPDGNMIVYRSIRNSFSEICVMNADGSNVTRLTYDTLSHKGSPCWSPDGDWIVYSTDADGDEEIFKMRKDGSSKIKLTDNSFLDRLPVWSPSGDKIAFVSDRQGSWELWLMNNDGGDPTCLSIGGVSPCWSPDGYRIAYCDGKDGDYEIYIINVDGGNNIKITNNLSDDFEPSWSR